MTHTDHARRFLSRTTRLLPARAPRPVLITLGMLTLAACAAETPASRESAARESAAAPARAAGTVSPVRDTSVSARRAASGVAEPLQQATLSTKLMGTVTAVLVREGDAVSSGQVLVRIDARDLDAKKLQVAAAIADAEAMQAEASTHAARFRALYADSAATRAQYDAALTGLARADAGVRAARASAGELEAVNSYATVRAPFAGVVTMRFADPGTFAAPGAPLLTVQSSGTLRISASIDADAARHLTRGQKLDATIDGVAAKAVVEGVVPAGAGNLFTVNATVDNRRALYRSGSAAELLIPTGMKRALLIPTAALIHEGDLIGVMVRGSARDERRWIRVGATQGTLVEVTSGLVAGEQIVVPSATATPPGA